jgi:hypothetical protein
VGLTNRATRDSFLFLSSTMSDFRLRRGVRHSANYLVAPTRGFVRVVHIFVFAAH